MVVGLTSQDTAENAIAELGLDQVRFTTPVHHGDTIYAYSAVLEASASDAHPDAGVVRFQHWGLNQHKVVVCEMQRTVLIKRRSHWARPA
jgi:acyl dehydratase